MFRILSCDGGGMRGIGTLFLLQEIEKRTGRKVIELFDMFAGTSTGSIIALGLATPKQYLTVKSLTEEQELIRISQEAITHLDFHCEKAILKLKTLGILSNGSTKATGVTFSNTDPEYSVEDIIKIYRNEGKFVFSQELATRITKFDFFQFLVHSILFQCMFGLNGASDMLNIYLTTAGASLGMSPLRGRYLSAVNLSVQIFFCQYPMLGAIPWSNYNAFLTPFLLANFTWPKFLKRLGEAKYYNINLKILCDRYFGYTSFKSLLKPVLVTSYNVTDKEVSFFTNSEKDDNQLVSDIIMASATAPTFFPSWKLKDKYYIDGGVAANNPALSATLWAKNHVPIQNIQVVSIGTGVFFEKNGTIFDSVMGAGALHALSMPSMFLEAQQDLVEQQIQQIIPKENYHRMQFTLNKQLPLDSLSKADIHHIEQRVSEYIASNSDKIDEICSILLKNIDQNASHGGRDFSNYLKIEESYKYRNKNKGFISSLLLFGLILIYLTYCIVAMLEEQYTFYEIKQAVKKGNYDLVESHVNNFMQEFKEIMNINSKSGEISRIGYHMQRLIFYFLVIRESLDKDNCDMAFRYMQKIHKIFYDMPRPTAGIQYGHGIIYFNALNYLIEESANKGRYDIAWMVVNLAYKDANTEKNRESIDDQLANVKKRITFFAEKRGEIATCNSAKDNFLKQESLSIKNAKEVVKVKKL